MEKVPAMSEEDAKAKLLADSRVNLAEIDAIFRKPGVYVELVEGWQFDDGATILFEDTWVEALEAVEGFAERKAAA